MVTVSNTATASTTAEGTSPSSVPRRYNADCATPVDAGAHPLMQAHSRYTHIATVDVARGDIITNIQLFHELSITIPTIAELFQLTRARPYNPALTAGVTIPELVGVTSLGAEVSEWYFTRPSQLFQLTRARPNNPALTAAVTIPELVGVTSLGAEVSEWYFTRPSQLFQLTRARPNNPALTAGVTFPQLEGVTSLGAEESGNCSNIYILCCFIITMAGVFQLVNALSSMVVNDVTPITMTSQTECAYKCYYGNSCLSFFYTADDRCYLLDEIMEVADSRLTELPNTRYFKANIVNCPGDAGYKYIPSIPLCYKLSTQKLSWSGAKAKCISEGGRLFQADTSHKMAWTYHNIKVTGSVWLGASDTAQEGQFMWTDDTEVEDPMWRDGEPSNTLGVQDCVLIGDDRLWDDVWCQESHFFLCELQTTSCL